LTDHSIPNTDPYLGDHNDLASRRVIYYQEPNQTVADAILRHQQATTPLQVSVNHFAVGHADLDNDQDVDLRDYAAFSMNWQNHDCNAPHWCGGADLNHSGIVDFNDFHVLTDCWLWAK
jgi:hypothetical protein